MAIDFIMDFRIKMTTTCEKLGEGVFLILWTNSDCDSSSTTSTDMEDVFQSVKLNYAVEEEDDEEDVDHEVYLELEFLPNNDIKKTKFTQSWEPTNVLAIKHGEKQEMELIDSKWVTRFPYAFVCCKDAVTFEIIITFANKSTTPKKKGSERVVSHLAHLWETKELADVTFQFEDEQIHAHTLIVTSGSCVLAAMIKRDIQVDEKCVIKINDVKVSVFKCLLRFIYTGDFDLEQVDVASLFVAADKYGVEFLKEECALTLMNELSVDNASVYLVLSHLHNCPDLFKAAMDFMSKHPKEICSRMDWMNIIVNYPQLCFQATQNMIGF